MAINHQVPMANTSMGLRRREDPLCYRCRERIPGDVLMTLNAYNQPICPDCAGEPAKSPLRGVCSEGECACSTEAPAEG